jgi:hypothetical protein
MTLRREIVDYILENTEHGKRQPELDLFHRVLEELNSNVEQLKDMSHKAGIWQGKYTDCKKEITILRQRKSYYKRLCRERGSLQRKNLADIQERFSRPPEEDPTVFSGIFPSPKM